MPNPSISFPLTGASQNSNSNGGGPDFNVPTPTPTFTRQPRAILPATTNQLEFTPPALPQPLMPAGQLPIKRKLASSTQEANILNTRYEPHPRIVATSAKDLRYIRALATTDLTNTQLTQLKEVSPSRSLVNKTFVDRGGSENVREILLNSLARQGLNSGEAYLKSMVSQMANEKPVNPDAILGIYHAGNAFLAKHNERYTGDYEQLKEFVPKELLKSTNYLFENPPSMAEYLLPRFEEIVAANPAAMLPLGSKEDTLYLDLKFRDLIPRKDLHSFLEGRDDQSKRKRQHTDAPVAQTPPIPSAPQGFQGLPVPGPLGDAVHGGGIRSSTSDVMPMPQQLTNAKAQAAGTSAGADEDWNSLFGKMQQDWLTPLRQPSSAPPLTPNAQSTAIATAIRPSVLPGNLSSPTVSQEPAPAVAPSHWNGGQNQPFRQQASGQFADINASIKYLEELIKQNEVPLTQATSGNPQYQPSPLYASTQDPDNGFSRNAPLSSAPLVDLTALQPDNSYNDLFALIESFPIMESGASTVNSNSTLNQSSTYDNLSDPAVTTAPTGQLSNVWAPPTVAQAWNGGSTNAPQFLNPNQAYPQPSNQPQAPSQALVTMPGTYPTANSQFPTNFSNNPPFNSSLAPNPLAPSNSFHDYSRLLHQQQPQQPQQPQPQPQQNMATPAFYSSMPMNSYSAQQINQYNGPTSNYFAMPATNYSFMPSNSMPATAIGTSAMPAAPANGAGGAGGAGSMGASSAYPYQW